MGAATAQPKTSVAGAPSTPQQPHSVRHFEQGRRVLISRIFQIEPLSPGQCGERIGIPTDGSDQCSLSLNYR